MLVGDLQVDANASEDFDEFKRIDQIPSSMATQFIESIVVAGFKKSEFIHEFIHEMSRLMAKRCEDTNSVANVLLSHFTDHDFFSSYLYLGVMIFEIALRDCTFLKGGIAAKVFGMHTAGFGWQGKLFSVLKADLRVTRLQGTSELVLSILPQVVRILGDMTMLMVQRKARGRYQLARLS